jgi:type I restriction enzyme, S subunit
VSEPGTDLAVTLGDVAAEPIEQTGPTGNFVYVDISSIDRESKRIVGEKQISAVDAPSRAKQILRAGDVLVSMTRPNLNAVSIVPDRLDGAIASTGFHVLRSKWVDPKFLFNLVQTDEFIDSMCDVVQGALYPAVRPKDIASFTFNLQSSNQQTRIVEKLEELLSDLDAGVAELKAAQAKLVRYRQSLLKAAFEGTLTAEWRAARAGAHPPPRAGEGRGGGAVPPSQPSPARGGRGQSDSGAQLLQRILSERHARWEAKQLAKFGEQGKAPPKNWHKKYPEPVQPDTRDLPELPEGWAWASVDQLCFVIRGASPRPAGDPRYFGGSIPWITVGSITRDDEIYLQSTEQFVTEAGKAASRFIETGTLLFTNSGATLGVPKIAKICGCINDGSVALLDIDETTKLYLYWFLKTQTEKLRALNQGAAQPNLNTDIVRRICVPICTKPEMLEVLKVIEETINSAKSQEKSLETALKKSTAQHKNILRAAFSGQLVPQDPNDEPASALLARIRARREQRTADKAPRRRKESA